MPPVSPRPLRRAPALVLPLLLITPLSAVRSTPAHPASPHQPSPPAIVAQIGGAMTNVVQVGEHAYLGIGPRVVALDVSDPAHPREVGASAPLAHPIHHVAARGTTLFAAGTDLTALDIADPTRPVVLGTLPAGADQVVLDGDFAYVLSGVGAFPIDWVIDIRDPRAMRKVGELPPSSPKSALVVHPDPTVRFAWGAYNVFIHVLDTRDPAAVVKVAEADHNVHTYRLAADGRFLFAATNTGLMVGVLDPPLPGLLLTLATTAPLIDIDVAGGTALLVVGGELRVVDVTHPAQPILRGVAPVPGARSVSRVGGFAYVTGAGGLTVVDVRDPAAPRIGEHLPAIDTVNDIALAGDLAYVAAGDSGLAVVNVADRAAPVLITVVDAGFSARHVVVEDGHAYVVGAGPQGSGQLAVFDLGRPVAPVRVGAVPTGAGAADVAVQNGYAFVASGRPGMTVIDARDPATPRVLASTGEAWWTTGVLVDGPTAYVVDRLTGLWVLDVADPASPTMLASVPLLTQREARGLALADRTLYATASRVPITRMFEDEWSQDVLPIDVTDPAHPQPLPFLMTEVRAKDLLVAGDRAYVASGRVIQRDFDSHAQLVVLRNLAAGAAGLRRWALDLPQVPTGIAVAGDHAFVATGDAGLLVVPVADAVLDLPPATPTATVPPLPTRTLPPGVVTDTPAATPTVLPTPTRRPIPNAPTGGVYLPVLYAGTPASTGSARSPAASCRTPAAAANAAARSVRSHGRSRSDRPKWP